ncbi:MAG: LacI family transcriptional regulator [Clostridia bacterium]|nr:LacI family transcriptional regulator [Clostridia bacterium]
MPKKVSMQDIADKLGVSKNTISLALRGMPGISEQTRKLILDTVSEYGYEYKKKASSDKNDVSLGNLCLILSKSTMKSADFFSYIQFGIENEAKNNHLNIFLYCYDELENEFETPLCIKDGLINGVITLGRISEKNLDVIRSYGLPLVMVDHYFDHTRTDCILTDNHCGGYLAAEHLIKNGHKKIGFCGNIDFSISFYDRYQGFLKALVSYGIPLKEEFMLIDKSMNELIAGGVQEAVKVFEKLHEMPTAIFCCNDVEAIALYKVFSAMGLSIPEDISIIGFDDTEASVNINPELTTMHIEKDLMGKKAVQRLIQKLNEDAQMEEKILISTPLVQRGSVKNIN